MESIWKRYGVTLQVTNEFMAGIPKNPEVIAAWLEARQPTEAALARRQANGETITLLPELAAEVAGQVDASVGAEDKVWSGFKKDERGLYVDGSNVKAHLKDCANILKDIVGVKALRSKVADRIYVEDERVYLGVTEPDSYFEHPVHVMTMQGPRSALKRNDYVRQPRLTFVLRTLREKYTSEHGKIEPEELLRTMFEYGGTHGIGAERGLGYGRYELVSLAELS